MPPSDAEGAAGQRRSSDATSGRLDAFISHSSKDRSVAVAVERALGADRVWLDRSDIRIGALLGRELLSRLRKSRTLLLLWSEPASRSPWVQVEWLAAVNLNKPVLVLTVDDTEVPQCLANTVRLALVPPIEDSLAEVTRVFQGSLPRGGSTSPPMRLPDASLELRIERLASDQYAVLDNLAAGELGEAKRRQRILERRIKSLLAKHPLHPDVAVLWAYNAKNRVLLDHDKEIRSGIRVVDRRLDAARWRFIRALWLDPFSPGALNGLGTISWFGHDLDTAEFFVRAAIRQQPRYTAALQDLQLIRRLKGRKGS